MPVCTFSVTGPVLVKPGMNVSGMPASQDDCRITGLVAAMVCALALPALVPPLNNTPLSEYVVPVLRVTICASGAAIELLPIIAVTGVLGLTPLFPAL